MCYSMVAVIYVGFVLKDEFYHDLQAYKREVILTKY